MTIQPLDTSIAECVRLLDDIQTAVITAHVNPDGDAVGSELALFHLLKNQGKDVTVINSSPLPVTYDFLEGSSSILEYNPERDNALLNSCDALFVLDCNAPKRVKTMEEIVISSPVRKVVIDHHLEPKPFADLYVVDTDASSTAEILWRLTDHYGKQAFTKPIAEALYTGIFTDTGGFRYPRTDAELLCMVAGLLEVGVDPTYVYEKIYNRGALNRTRLLGRALVSLRVFHHGRLCIMTVTQEMLREMQASEDLTEGFVEHTLSLDGVKVGVLIVEMADVVKMSFRSKDQIPANTFAEFFNGGGHLNAAGARTRDYTLEEVIDKIVEMVASHV